nr:MAG TPA: hypothetical protein [Caudoviricetes sp.]
MSSSHASSLPGRSSGGRPSQSAQWHSLPLWRAAFRHVSQNSAPSPESHSQRDASFFLLP